MTQATESVPSNNLRIVDIDLIAETESGESPEDSVLAPEAKAEEASPKSSEETSSTIPEKFQGKSVEEVIEAYQNLEKKFGQQGNDLGELRKMTDQMMLEQLTQINQHLTPKPQPEPEITDEDFLVNPKEVIEKIVNERVKAVTDKLESKDKETAIQALEAKHPDMVEIVQDVKFQEWVLESPAREANWAKASQGDFIQADELFSLYKELHQPQPQSTVVDPESTEPSEDPDPIDEAALQTAVNVVTGQGQDATSGTKPAKVFSRRRLVQLQVENPAKYQALAPEITLAYQEGRVVD